MSLRLLEGCGIVGGGGGGPFVPYYSSGVDVWYIRTIGGYLVRCVGLQGRYSGLSVVGGSGVLG